MDIFGIGNAIKGVVEIYFRMSRRTGRTTQLMECLQNGDRVVCTNTREANLISILCDQKGLENIRTVVIDPKNPWTYFTSNMGYPASKSRLFFDHVWIEEYHKHCVEIAQNDIQKWSERFSSDTIDTPVSVDMRIYHT